MTRARASHLGAALTVSAVLCSAATACSRFGPVYPSRPTAATGAPESDPDPARVVVHVAVGSRALASAVDEAAPRTGEGTFALLGSDRRYSWERGPFEV